MQQIKAVSGNGTSLRTNRQPASSISIGGRLMVCQKKTTSNSFTVLLCLVFVSEHGRESFAKETPSNLSQLDVNICTGTFYAKHYNLLDPDLPVCTGALRNLVRNLVLKVRRIAPELVGAKGPIAKCCGWGKSSSWEKRSWNPQLLEFRASDFQGAIWAVLHYLWIDGVCGYCSNFHCLSRYH